MVRRLESITKEERQVLQPEKRKATGISLQFSVN